MSDLIKDPQLILAMQELGRGLKKAYPNYFADTIEFSKNLERLIEANKTFNSVS